MSIFAHKISVNYEEKCFYCRIDGYGDIPKKKKRKVIGEYI